MSWEKITVGDLGKVITGNTPPKKNLEYYGKDYKFIKPTDMEIGMRYTPVTEEYYSVEGFKKYQTSLIPPLSTCVVTIGSIGKKITLSDDYCFVNQAVNAVVPNEEKYDPYFVFYALKNILHKVKSADTGASSGRENVSKSNFSSLTLEVPEDIITQQKIASILSAYDDLIENNLQRIKLLEETAQNIYKEWFVHFRFPGSETVSLENGLPRGWQKKQLRDVIELNYGKALKAEERIDGEIPVFGSSGIVGFHNFSIAKAPSIIVGRKGNVGSVFWASKDFYPIDTVYYVNSELSYYYLYFNLQKQNYVNSDAAVPGLNRNSAYQLQIIIPSEDLIISFEKIVSPIFNQTDVLQQQNQKLKEARDILLPRLMNRTIELFQNSIPQP